MKSLTNRNHIWTDYVHWGLLSFRCVYRMMKYDVHLISKFSYRKFLNSVSEFLRMHVCRLITFSFLSFIMLLFIIDKNLQISSEKYNVRDRKKSNLFFLSAKVVFKRLIIFFSSHTRIFRIGYQLVLTSKNK